MPYETVGGSHELASRLGHQTAAVRAIADQRTFHVPAEALHNVDDLRKKVRPHADFNFPRDDVRLAAPEQHGHFRASHDVPRRCCLANTRLVGALRAAHRQLEP